MWPLDRAKTVSVTPSDAMSSDGSRTTHGSTVNGRPGSGLIALPRCARSTIRHSAVTSIRSQARSWPLAQQLGEVADDDVRAVPAQRLGLTEPVHAHHEAESARAAGLDPGEGVLEHHRLLLGHAQVGRRGEV